MAYFHIRMKLIQLQGRFIERESRVHPQQHTVRLQSQSKQQMETFQATKKRRHIHTDPADHYNILL